MDGDLLGDPFFSSFFGGQLNGFRCSSFFPGYPREGGACLDSVNVGFQMPFHLPPRLCQHWKPPQERGELQVWHSWEAEFGQEEKLDSVYENKTC